MQDLPTDLTTSGVPGLDEVLNGGLRRGRVYFVEGETGSGKTTLALQFALAGVAAKERVLMISLSESSHELGLIARSHGWSLDNLTVRDLAEAHSDEATTTLCTQFGLAFAERGERAAIYLFEESVEVFRLRARSQGLDIESQGERIQVRAVNPAELTPGEFSSGLARSIRTQGVRLVIIDSLNGYLQAMPDERFMSLHVHDILSFLAQQGVITLLTMSQPSPAGGSLTLPVELSYLADTVVTQRYFEAMGSIRYAISVLKKRYGDHERTIREYRIGSKGLTLGDPLTQFSGVLLASPAYLGGEEGPALL